LAPSDFARTLQRKTPRSNIVGGKKMTSAIPASQHWRIWLTLFCLAFPLQMTVTASPFINDISMTLRGLNTDQIGIVRTAEILFSASLGIFLGPRIIKVEPRVLALIGMSCFLAGNLAAIPGVGFWDLAAARVLAGAGAGMTLASMAPFGAQLPRPERVAAALALPITGLAIATAFIAGAQAKAVNPAGVFGLLAGAAVVSVIVVAFCAPGGRFHAGFQPKFGSLLGALRQPYVLGWATIYLGSTAVYHFLVKLGAGHGLNAEQVGQLAGITGIVCGLAAPLAFLVRDSFLRWAFLAAVLLFGIGSSAIPLAFNAYGFAGAFIAQSVAFTFMQILTSGVSARLDRTGGLGAAAGGWNSLGNAFSPALGGVLIAGGSYWPLGALCAIASLVTLSLFFVATRALNTPDPHLMPAKPQPDAP
jgi:predicted MFS family arabinose efflux permease